MEDVVDQFYRDLAAKPQSDVLILARYYGIEGSYPAILQQIAERHALSFRSGQMYVGIGDKQVMDNVTTYSHYGDRYLHEIAKLTQLKTLELYTVTTIPPEICAMDIEKLVIDAPKFTFPVCFSSFPHLLELSIEHCNVTNAEEVNWTALKLTTLTLRNVGSSILPFMALTSLRVLTMGRMKLHDLPREFSQLTSLEKLYLPNNYFKVFPDILFDPALHIQHLSISWTPGIDLPQRDYPFLSLNVSDCALIDLPDFSGSAINILSASRNRIITFPNLPEWIEEVHLDKNLIDSFPDTKNYPFLKVLDLNDNPIPVTPELIPYLLLIPVSTPLREKIEAFLEKDAVCYNPYKYLKNTQSEILGNVFETESLPRPDLLRDVRSRKVSDPFDVTNLDGLASSQLCHLLYSELPSLEWIEAQRYYTHHLSPKQLLFLHGYEYNGDVLLNTWIRSDFSITDEVESYFQAHRSTFKPMIQRYIVLEPRKEYLSDFLTDFYLALQSVIWNAPEVDREFVAYRGQAGNHSLETSVGFNSNSISPKSAIGFIKNGYMLRTVIPKGSKCFLLTGEDLIYQEYEVLLPDQAQFDQVSPSAIHKGYPQNPLTFQMIIPTFDRTYSHWDQYLPSVTNTGKKLTDYFAPINYT